jgi:hypothetical protein
MNWTLPLSKPEQQAFCHPGLLNMGSKPIKTDIQGDKNVHEGLLRNSSI